MAERSDVLVVGAGPTGLVLACGLALRGVAVRVVDRAAGPATTSRANILHARGVEVLDRIGALGDLPERALAPLGMTMHARNRPLSTMRFRPLDGESTQALFVSQADIEERLRRRAAGLGVDVAWGRRVTGLEQDGDGATAVLADGSRAPARWVVGCDGAHSAVRDLAGIDFPGVTVVEQFLLADARMDWDRDRSVSAGWFHRDGMVLAIPMPDGPGAERADGDLWRLMADVPATDERLDARRIVARIEALLPVRTGDTGASVRDAVWTSVFRVRRRLAADYRRGRVLLAGDAAHVHSPIGGQGMNTGIGDAENLAWKLALVARDRADAGLLDTYAAERRPLAADVLSTTTANTRMLVGEGPVTRLIRDRVFVPLLNLPAVQRRATRTASQLDVSYRTGPLGGPRRAAGPRPGDRVPDRDCLRPDGTPTRLYAELGSGWVVLAPHGAPGAEAAAEAARDRLGERVTLLHPRAAEPGGTVLLVRPDGHAGGVGAAGADGLGRYLDAVLLGAGGGR